MIRMNWDRQCLRCSVCGQTVELRRRNARNAETLVLLMEQMGEEHAPCEQYPGNPAMARLEHAYRAGMKREMRQA